MLQGAHIAVVVPAHNEAPLIGQVLSTMPPWVDLVVVVDDASTDCTARIAEGHRDPRVRVVRHARNCGVGAAIATGYRKACALGAEVVAVMAGDAQMDPNDLRALLQPVLDGTADYAKGTRLSHPDISRMPLLRRLGTQAFGWATRIALQMPSLSDSQCGYTAMSSRAIEQLDLGGLWPRYGYPNDLLVQLRVRGLRLAEVQVRPVYGTERSGLRFRHGLVIGFLIARGAWRVRKRK